MSLLFACCDERRRAALLGHSSLNGIDDLRVESLAAADLDAVEQAEQLQLPPNRRAELLWQRRLTLRFVNPLTGPQLGLTSEQVQIEGGARVRGISALVLSAGGQEIVLKASMAGDFSRYTLRLVRSSTDDRPPLGFDPILSRIDFSFKVNCPSEFDCRDAHVCLRPAAVEPVIDYLAKDYGSFRRVLLDRMALLAPQWRERNPADLGIALVEVLAYAGDQLSYFQDAVATEAYLATARKRTSIRRLARLVDYSMHQGSNARTWIQVEVAADTIVGQDLRCISGALALPDRIAPGSPEEEAAENSASEWFEIVTPDPDPAAVSAPIELFADHNHMTFYTWGDDECCLPAGATRATLRGAHPDLAVGMVLVLEEALGPKTGDAADADPAARQAVRLVDVRHSDEGNALVDPLDGTPITEIEWHRGDALTRPFCISARTTDNAPVADATVIRGNVLLVDHGRRIGPEPLGSVHRLQRPVPDGPAGGCDDVPAACDPSELQVETRFRPSLERGPISMTAVVPVVQSTMTGLRRRALRFDPGGSARSALLTDPADARPFVLVTSLLNGVTRTWTAVSDLLNSGASGLDAVVEVEDDGPTGLRFGDGEHGRRPEVGEDFVAHYRIGNGRAGNVGAEAIQHVVSADARIVRVRNPLPATGGRDPESLAEVRRRAPQAFRSQRRAVTPADYENRTVERPGIQRASARLRWTGSWHTHFVAVDRSSGAPVDESLEGDLRAFVEPYRLAGHDLEFDDPTFVALELALEVCVADGYFRGDVRRRLFEVLSNRLLPDGRRGVFHPEQLTFGQSVYLSPLLAAAHAVEGVASATATRFGRLGGADGGRALDDGYIGLNALEIARLDNDPDWPERGVLRLDLLGGA